MWRGLVTIGLLTLTACGDIGAVGVAAGGSANGGGDAGGAGGAAGGAGGAGTATGEGSASASSDPAPKACRVNCCDGTIESLPGEHFEADACELSVKEGVLCDEHGGPANAFFDGAIVWQDLACSGSCAVNCCDGTAIFGEPANQDECELAAAFACGEAQGGPSTVAFDQVLAWTAEGKCPSLLPCILTCNDGAESAAQHYLSKVCVQLSVESAFCDAHGGIHTVYFDSQPAWP